MQHAAYTSTATRERERKRKAAAIAPRAFGHAILRLASQTVSWQRLLIKLRSEKNLISSPTNRTSAPTSNSRLASSKQTKAGECLTDADVRTSSLAFLSSRKNEAANLGWRFPLSRSRPPQTNEMSRSHSPLPAVCTFCGQLTKGASVYNVRTEGEGGLPKRR